eukprot:TRINITY_DN2094_c0_g1_i2.p1 TRINITY_DN2094_c0_g1~~TRINITY_DN2094_c0_g1_i2.p1  ORF type:complete len:494 (-),score=72.46 TRINITY_DN2094_c0_g1_i2:11-1492(-)
MKRRSTRQAGARAGPVQQALPLIDDIMTIIINMLDFRTLVRLDTTCRQYESGYWWDFLHEIAFLGPSHINLCKMPKILLHHQRLTSVVIRSLRGIHESTKEFFSAVGFDLQSLTWEFSSDTEDKSCCDDSSVSDSPWSDIGELDSSDEEKYDSEFHLFDYAIRQLNPANLQSLRFEGRRGTQQTPLPLIILMQSPLPNLKSFYSSAESTLHMLTLLTSSAPNLENIELAASYSRVFTALSGVAALSKSHKRKDKLKRISINAIPEPDVSREPWIETALDFDPDHLLPAAAYDAYCVKMYGVHLSAFTVGGLTLWESVCTLSSKPPKQSQGQAPAQGQDQPRHLLPLLDNLFQYCYTDARSSMNALIKRGPVLLRSVPSATAYLVSKCVQLIETVCFSVEAECRAFMTLMQLVIGDAPPQWDQIRPAKDLLIQAIDANPVCYSCIGNQSVMADVVRDKKFVDIRAKTPHIELTSPFTMGPAPTTVLKSIQGPHT